MVLESRELLKQEGLSPLTQSILAVCAKLDGWGARTWSLRRVGVITAIVLLVVRKVLKKQRGIDWYALLHAIVSSAASLACVYLDLYASEKLTGTPEPLRSLQCQGPLTSLHWVSPAITLGYSLYDLIDGLSISLDFALHGVATVMVMLLFCEIGAPQLLSSSLIMEVSTIFLSMIRADFFSPTLAMTNMALFALSFFAFRIILSPYLWFKLMFTMWEQSSTELYRNCFPSFVFPFCLISGIFFHLLNLYWFIKIVKKLKRKVLQIEKVHEDNDIAESEHRETSENGDKKNK